MRIPLSECEVGVFHKFDENHAMFIPTRVDWYKWPGRIGTFEEFKKIYPYYVSSTTLRYKTKQRH